MGKIQVQTSTLVDHIGIEAFRPEQCDPRMQALPFIDKHLQLRLKVHDLTLDCRTPHEAELAVEGMEPEIHESRHGGCRNDQTS